MKESKREVLLYLCVAVAHYNDILECKTISFFGIGLLHSLRYENSLSSLDNFPFLIRKIELLV